MKVCLSQLDNSIHKFLSTVLAAFQLPSHRNDVQRLTENFQNDVLHILLKLRSNPPKDFSPLEGAIRRHAHEGFSELLATAQQRQPIACQAAIPKLSGTQL